MSSALLLLVATALAGAEAVPAPAASAAELSLTRGGQAISDQYAAEVRRAYAAYRAQAQKAQDAAAAKLQQEVERETRKGNLDGALRLRQEAEAVKAGRLQAEVEMAARADVLGNLPADAGGPLSALAGTWSLAYNLFGHTRTIRIDGQGAVEVLASSWGGVGGVYQLERVEGRTDLLTGVTAGEALPGAHRETYRITAGRLQVEHWWPADRWPAGGATTTATGTRAKDQRRPAP